MKTEAEIKEIINNNNKIIEKVMLPKIDSLRGLIRWDKYSPDLSGTKQEDTN